MALEKSTVNPEQPSVQEGKPRGKGMPSEPPQADSKTGGSDNAVIVTEAQPRKSGGSTFRAPRVDPSGGPMELGYTKVKM